MTDEDGDGIREVTAGPCEDALGRFERTIDVQSELLDGIDNKAARVVQHTSILLGTLITAISLVPQTDGFDFADISLTTKASFYLGIAFLLGAIGLAVVTYLSSVIKYGLARNFGYRVAEGVVDSPDYEEAILIAYADAVEDNRTVINKNAQRFRLSLGCLLLGLVSLTLSGVLLISSFDWLAELGIVFVAVLVTAKTGHYIYREDYLVLERETVR